MKRVDCPMCGMRPRPSNLARHLARHTADVPERFWRHVEPVGDCWEWTARKVTGGYGQYQLPTGENVMAHRLAWSLLVGPIEAETLDHLCTNKACVKPDHLEPVSLAENIRRSKVRHVCRNGHRYLPSNTIVRTNGGKRPRTSRRCRTCLETR